jgi:hypothetical protein
MKGTWPQSSGGMEAQRQDTAKSSTTHELCCAAVKKSTRARGPSLVDDDPAARGVRSSLTECGDSQAQNAGAAAEQEAEQEADATIGCEREAQSDNREKASESPYSFIMRHSLCGSVLLVH